jgi:hypothetical protein
MRTRIGWLVVLLTAGMGLAPTAVRGQGQDVPPADPAFPLPLYHRHPESGGLYIAGEFLFMRQSRLIRDQVIAVRGLIDIDGSITATLFGQSVPGTFIGSGAPALNAASLGPISYQPGWSIIAGYRFQDGVALEASWKHLVQAKYNAGAGIIPSTFQPGTILQDTFLTAFVHNFPLDYAGPDVEVNPQVGNAGATFGIWNAASLMTIDFVQRYNQFDMTLRVPVYQNDCARWYGLVGPRFSWFWERFRWRTVGADFLGNSGPEDVANYSNTLSQRMYGVHLGAGSEWYLFNGFSISVDLGGALLLDVAKERAKYERGDNFTSARRARTEYTIVPEAHARAHLWWYPIEGVQVRVGYDFMAFFNTIASPQPVSFHFGTLDPPWDKGFTRLLDGFSAGIAFIF